MIDTKLHQHFDDFLFRSKDAWHKNEWLYGDYLRVYMRYGSLILCPPFTNPIKNELSPTDNVITLSTVSDIQSKHQLLGIFPAFLDHLESKRLPIYVENVMPEQLHWYFERRNYALSHNSVPDVYNCYYKLPS